MTSIPTPGIPRVLHQTWHTFPVPIETGDTASWQRLNPRWQYQFWDDTALRDFMAGQFPQLLQVYDGYTYPVQRADLARYCLLKHFGGVYADVDTRCLQSLEPLAGDPRVILCEEPRDRQHHAHRRGLPALLFNGTMASPAGHPLWDAVIDHCLRMSSRTTGNVLETTGPLILSAAVAQWAQPDEIALHSSHLFAESDSDRCPPAERFGPFRDLCVSQHFWQGSWFRERPPHALKRAVTKLRKLRHRLRGRRPGLAALRARMDETLLHREIPADERFPKVTILIPVRNGASTLARNLDAILGIDYPKNRIQIVYGEGDSSDETPEILKGLIARHAATFAGMRRLETRRNAPHFPHARRWRPAFQAKRRAGLARARNELVRQVLTDDSDWILWMDADVIGLPSDLLTALLAVREKIVTPDCVLESDGPSYDLNAFLDIGEPGEVEYMRHVRGGIFQPPVNYWARRHLDDLRYLDRVPLNGVGGTVLLVRADLHRAGLLFPETPYRDLLETEGLGQLARDLGIVPVGLPSVQVLHDRQ
ncbi:glycosyltransferase [Neorhizobium galegae]|uniref:glycosyltransferase n=1 Tax=Neorhizobium galegae TaxID=399 RepID=UPI001FD89338|nr:glycosyltransferase [Neorhizobium galegae]